MKRHAQVERAKSVAVLKTRLKTALKELANALAENGRYKIKLDTHRSLEKNIVHQQYFSQNANEALSVSLGREMLAESRLKWLRRQNASLKLELAQLMLLKDDIHKLKEALCVAELRCDETYVSSLLKVVATQASPRLQDTKLLHMGLPGIFRDKARWLLKRQYHLQQHILKIGKVADLVPLLRAKLAKLKGKYGTTRDTLVNYTYKHALLNKQLKRAKVAEQIALIQNTQLCNLTSSAVERKDKSTHLCIRSVFGEMGDELKIINEQLSVQTKRTRIATDALSASPLAVLGADTEN